MTRYRFVAWLSLLLGLACAASTWAATVELPNGDSYQGETLDGQRHGHGVYIWENGNRYEGEFFANRMHGEGTFTWADGRTYVGNFAED
ncbi:MAG: hypothetical protein RIC89_08320 [Pseudomonadales bacterium]